MEISDFLSHFEKVKSNDNGSYMACCPAHDDKNPSLSIKDTDERIMVHCFTGCSKEDVVSAAGLKMSDLNKAQREYKQNEKWTFLREHIYTDENGVTVAKKIMYRKPDGSKTGVWQRYDGRKYVKGLGDVKPPLFRVSDLKNADTGVTFYIAEGEKDVETLVKMGYVATTSPYGAGSGWSKAYNSYFENRDVVILADNDEPGRNAAQKTAAALCKSASSIKIIPSEKIKPDLLKKGDISDIVDEVGIDKAKEMLIAAVKAVEVFDAPEAAQITDTENNNGGDTLPDYFFYHGRENQVRVSCPLLAKHIRENSHYIFEKNQAVGCVNRFWYSDGVYKPVSDDMLRGRIKSYISDYCEKALHMRDVNEVFQHLTTDDNFVEQSEINADENIINFQNGILHLDTLELTPHSPDILSTIQIPCKWNPEAGAAPVFEQYIADLTAGDAEKRELLLQFIGACISNVKGFSFKKSLFMVGPGNTGKSQIKSLAERIIGGDNCCAIDLPELEERFGTSSLYGKRLAGSNDMKFANIGQLKIFKQLTGGDAVLMERKGKDQFTSKYNGLLWFAMNELPRFGGDRGQWVYDRIAIMRCDNQIPVEKQDAKICDKMFAERETIVFLAVDALRRAIANNYQFCIPKSSQAELREYQVLNSPAITFFDECCVIREIKSENDCSTSKMHKVFAEWCKQNVRNRYTLTPAEFKKEIAEYLNMDADDIVKKVHGERRYIFTLTRESKAEFERVYGIDAARREEKAHENTDFIAQGACYGQAVGACFSPN